MKLRRILFISFILILIGFFYKKIIVLCMIGGGVFVSPEGSEILRHYCFGNGDTLFLSPDYIRKSPIIIENLKKMQVGEQRKIAFKQKEDWRLSYALNPFVMIKKEDAVIIYQYIKFDRSGKTYTLLNLGGIKIRLYDNIVYAFDCKPFVAVCKFEMKE